MTLRAIYLDASAVVKLLVEERGSKELNELLSDGVVRLTSRISAIETARTLARRGLDPFVATAVFRAVSQREVDDDVVMLASTLRPVTLRTLDAIHLATALTVAASLDAFITYDVRLAEAATLHALRVVAPGS